MNVEKLPKWSQKLIRKLTRERDTAVDALNEYLDEQKLSSFYYEDHLCLGEESNVSYKKKYIQTYKMTVEHGGVKLTVYLRDNFIDLQWGDDKFHDDVAFIPSSYQAGRIIHRDNMHHMEVK